MLLQIVFVNQVHDAKLNSALTMYSVTNTDNNVKIIDCRWLIL